MVSHQCEFVNESSSEIFDRIVFHIDHTCMVSPSSEFACVSSSDLTEWTICHTHHKCKVFHQCVCEYGIWENLDLHKCTHNVCKKTDVRQCVYDYVELNWLSDSTFSRTFHIEMASLPCGWVSDDSNHVSNFQFCCISSLFEHCFNSFPQCFTLTQGSIFWPKVLAELLVTK